MQIDFNTIYKEKYSEGISALLWKDIQSILHTQYGEKPDYFISKRVDTEWFAMEQSDTILDVAALYEITLWLKKTIFLIGYVAVLVPVSFSIF